MPGGSEQQIIIQSLVMQAKSVQLVRNREYDVVMLYRKRSPDQVIDPKRLFSSLAFGTVPVATAVVAVTDRTTAVTYFFMPAQGIRSATGDLPQHLLLQGC